MSKIGSYWATELHRGDRLCRRVNCVDNLDDATKREEGLVFIHNDLAVSAPDLLRIVRTLRAALDIHGEHLLGCSYHAPSATPCNCGLDAALDEGAEILRRLDHE